MCHKAKPITKLFRRAVCKIRVKEETNGQLMSTDHAKSSPCLRYVLKGKQLCAHSCTQKNPLYKETKSNLKDAFQQLS